VYAPSGTDSGRGDTGNEHFLAFEGPDRSLMAVWTQSSYEGKPDQRVVLARSDDGRRSWTPPRVLAGPNSPQGTGMASWGFPMVSRSGRIYVLYNRHVGINDIFTHTTGWMAGIYSDDAGRTWSAEQRVSMRRSKWDHPDPSVPPNWIVWQKPLRLSHGKYFVGMTRWVSPSVRPPAPTDSWTSAASVVEFMRFENVDDNPEPRALQVSFFARDDEAVRVGLPSHPAVSVVQEPSLVALPDGRLFCAMRTMTGHPHYTVSDDAGETWRPPEPMRQRDGGPLLRHPLSPCPIYAMGDGDYLFLYHNHDGHFLTWGPEDTGHHRRPVCLARGQYRPAARQPIWFSEPWFIMDNGGVPILRSDLAMYASTTPHERGLVLWYPDRKFFLLGKIIESELVLGLSVPRQGPEEGALPSV
jgi:hypothetical protein